MKLGLSGLIARTFITSPLTPLLLLASLAIGALALAVLPREEEPQISVPMVDIFVQANGLKAPDAVELVTRPLEDIVKGIDGVEHVYSQTQDDRVVVTARFKVGTDADAAIVRVHTKIRANYDKLPLGIPEPLIVGRGINDVAILTLTLSPKPGNPGRFDDTSLHTLATELQHELVKVDNVGLTYIAGGRPEQIRIEPEPERLSLYGVTLNQLVDKVQNANRSFLVGALRENDRNLPVVAGQTIQPGPDVGQLLITTSDGRPVYLKDVARVVMGGVPDDSRAWQIEKGKDGKLLRTPAVTVAIAKRQGANAVVVAEQVLKRLELVRGRLIPPTVDVAVTRNYGKTASDKADELLFHLVLASVSIVVLLTVFLGWREGVVVAVVIPATILLTFFAAWLMGFTINRVSMFALIFSIGILVDDAIVVVENMVRHWNMPGGRRDLARTAVEAVAEVGNPTIVATFTIIVALLPMMFVSGLMGPYMSPIPANASAAMLFSLMVAFTVTPWLMLKLRGKANGGAAGEGAEAGGTGGHGAHHHGHHGGILARAYVWVARWLLTGRLRSKVFLLSVAGLTLLSLGLFYTESVTVKLLPFDNKSELQVLVDLPQGATLEDTDRVLYQAAERLAGIPEMTSIQAYVGTAAPFNFNGLVRHSYLRSGPEQGELQVNLVPKEDRDRESHAIAIDVRNRLKNLAMPKDTVVQVVEVPPGPPVLATLLAEVYGPDAKTRREAAEKIRQAFKSVDFIVDVDDTFHKPGERLHFAIDQENLEYHRVEEQAVYDTIQTLIHGRSVGYSHRGHDAQPVEITIRLPKNEMTLDERLLSTPVPTQATKSGAPSGEVELGDVVDVGKQRASYPIFRRDGRFAEMVMGDLAGRFEAPIYGMLAVQDAIAKQDWGKEGPPAFKLHGQPEDESKTTLLWDGEWEITYVTFRDMGAAFIVAILGIYLLVVAQFRSFKVPLLVLVPVPLTLLGIMVGHWLLGAAFTATSMIGFIALAGIVVRNSILLIDFIRHLREGDIGLRDALLEAGAIRFKPIFLTAMAAMIGAAFILADPIFQGLAISLLFGLASSTLLTVLVIPAIYLWLRDDGKPLSPVLRP